MKISLCMIVKNEEENLYRCLNSVHQAVDEMIIVDTGSTDASCRIAREFGAQVETLIWDEDFSAARNRSLELATGDWILFLDADEELAPGSAPILRQLLTDDHISGYFLRIENYIGDERLIEMCPDLVFRLFRNRREYRFSGAVHEQIVQSVLADKEAKLGSAEQLVIRHYGYLNQQIEKKDKKNRNLAMITKQIAQHPEDQLLRYHYGVELYRAEQCDQAASELIKAADGLDAQTIYLPKLLRYIVLCFYADKKYDRALEFIDQGLTLYPQYADLHYHQGLIFYEQREYGKAYAAFQRALATPEQPSCYATFSGTRGFRAYYYLGQIAELFENEEEALHQYILSLRDNPAFLVSLECISKLLQPSEDPDYAKESLETICEFSTPQANLCMAEILYRQAAYLLSFAYFRQAAEGIEELPEVKLKSAVCLVQQHRYLEAIRIFDSFTPGHSLYPLAKFNKLFCFWVQGNRTKVRQLCQELMNLGLTQDSADMVGLLRDVLERPAVTTMNLTTEGIALFFDVLQRTLDMGEWEKAGRLLNGLQPQCIEELGSKVGKLYFDYGQMALAEKYVTIYLDKKNQEADAYYLLAQIKERQGLELEASAYYRQALLLEPKNPRPYVKLLRLYEYLRQEIWQQAVAKFPGIETLPLFSGEVGD